MVPTNPIEIPHLAKLCLDKVTDTLTKIYFLTVRSLISDEIQKCLHGLPNQGINGRCVSELFRGMLCNNTLLTTEIEILKSRVFNVCILIQCSADEASKLLTVSDDLSAHCTSWRNLNGNECATSENVAMDSDKIRIENENVVVDNEKIRTEFEDAAVDNEKIKSEHEDFAVDNEKIRTEYENEVCTFDICFDNKENTIENEQNTSMADVLLDSKKSRKESQGEVPITDAASLDSKKFTVETEQDVKSVIKLFKENNENSMLATIADDIYLVTTLLHFLRRMFRKAVKQESLFKSVIENKNKLTKEMDVELPNYEADFSDKKSAKVMPCGFGCDHGFYDSLEACLPVNYCSLRSVYVLQQESNCYYYKIDSTATKETGVARISRADIARINRTDIASINRTDIARVNRTDIARINRTDIASIKRADIGRSSRADRELLIVCINRTETCLLACLLSVHSVFTSQKQLPRRPIANRDNILSYPASENLSVLDFVASLLLHKKTEKSATKLEGLSGIHHEKNTYRQNICEISPLLSSRAVTYAAKPTSEHNNLLESSTICNGSSNQQMRFHVNKPNHDGAVQILQKNAVDQALFSIKFLGNKGFPVLVKNRNGRIADEKRNLAFSDVLDCIRIKKLQSQMQSFANRDEDLYGFVPSRMFANVYLTVLPLTVCGIPWNTFERETMRLASFAKYPNSAAKSPANLASCGFVYVGNGTSDRVKCYFCSVEKESWKMNDDIDEIHKSLSPSCPMVIVQFTNNVVSIESSPALSGATALSSSMPDGLESHRPQAAVNTAANSLNAGTGSAHSVYDEVDNLRTHVISQTATESTTHRSSSYQRPTANTNGSINTAGSPNPSSLPVLDMFQWATNSAARSNRINPQSQQSQSSDHLNEDATRNLQDHGAAHQGNVSHHPNINEQVYAISPGSNDTTTPDNATSVQPTPQLTYQLLGIFHERPKFPENAVLARRLQSFDGWPEDHPIKKEELAKSGLFFAGYGDCCKCFFCGGGLRNWESDDSAYVEHARWFDKCSYIRQFMGLEFVEGVQALKSRGGTITFQDVTNYMEARGQSIQNLFNDKKIGDDAAVRSLIDEGYNAEAVFRAATSLREGGEVLSADVILRKMRDQESQASGTAAAAAVPNGATYSEDLPDDAERMQALKEQNYALRSNLTCKICMDREVRIVFLPCGHLISCQECAIALQDCPLCRSHIRARARANIN